jgi:hypothetical protein
MITLERWRMCQHEPQSYVHIDPAAVDAIESRPRNLLGGGQKPCTWVQVGTRAYAVVEEAEVVADIVEAALQA